MCKATEIDTGQLRGNVWTPDKPLLTYEEAVCQHGTDRNLVLWVGPDIIPAGEDEFPKKRTEVDLNRIRKQVNEGQLPQLPPDVLPGGWDALVAGGSRGWTEARSRANPSPTGSRPGSDFTRFSGLATSATGVLVRCRFPVAVRDIHIGPSPNLGQCGAPLRNSGIPLDL